MISGNIFAVCSVLELGERRFTALVLELRKLLILRGILILRNEIHDFREIACAIGPINCVKFDTIIRGNARLTNLALRLDHTICRLQAFGPIATPSEYIAAGPTTAHNARLETSGARSMLEPLSHLLPGLACISSLALLTST